MKGRIFFIAALLAITMILSIEQAHADFAGSNTRGDYGLQSGSQPPPGFYVVPMYYRYDADSLKDSDGNNVINAQQESSLDVNAYILGFIWVSDFKIFGGNYSFQIYPALTDNALEIPVLGQEASVDTGFADLYLQPINLGWHTDRADFIAGLGLFAPTGEYEFGGSENLGLGMWSFEFFAGTTIYLDKAKTWQFATTAFYEFHSDKKDTNIRVGNVLTLEGGLGKTFMEGMANFGVAYYAQWKMTEDDLGLNIKPPGGLGLDKHRVYGLGPELSLPIATKKKLYGFIDARYIWEFGTRSTLEGNTLFVTASFPIPSVSLE